VTNAHRRLRIIGGEWRSRQIQFADLEEIRPTPDRVRETLFNWVKADIHGARCLEPFAGSGVLSLEALSRGAQHCTMLDCQPPAHHALMSNLRTLGAATDRYLCELADARHWLTKYNGPPFDLIFLDPPFVDDDLSELLTQLMRPTLLAEAGQVYVESGHQLEHVPIGTRIGRQKKAGAVHYALVTRQESL
jgi:16S rRNA (guanine966-N2)-methyltransferase